jgi:hypothetical protein
MSDRVFMQRAVEAAIRIGVIAGLIVWCFIIARPFLVPFVGRHNRDRSLSRLRVVADRPRWPAAAADW